MADEPTPDPGPTPSPTPEPVSDWRAGLPAELQAEASLGVIKGQSWEEAGPALARAFVETKRLVGNALRVPKADAKPEEWADFHARLGVPKEPTLEAYGVQLPDVGVPWDSAAVGSAIQALHAAGATPKVLKAALEAYAQYALGLRDRVTAEQAAARNAAFADAVKALETRWNAPKDSPGWKRQQALAEQAIHRLLGDEPPEVIDRIVEQANDPALAAAWAKVGAGLLEHGYIDGDAIPGGMTPEEAQRQADALRADKASPLWHPMHPLHERVMAQYHELNRIAAGPKGREVVVTR
jgi:hypothetical protein